MTMAASAVRDASSPRTAPPPASTTTVWWARLVRSSVRQERSLVAVNSDRFEDGSTTDLPGVVPPGRWPAGWLVDVRYRETDGAVVRVEVAERVAEPEEPLWFAETFHPTSSLPCASLLAFGGRAFPPGAVVTPYHVAARGVAMRSRIGEVRWGTRSGVVDTVTVAPAMRGQGIGRVLVTAAEGLCMLRGWPALRSDDRLPAEAADWLRRCPPYWRSRLAPGSVAGLQQRELPAGVVRLHR